VEKKMENSPKKRWQTTPKIGGKKVAKSVPKHVQFLYRNPEHTKNHTPRKTPKSRETRQNPKTAILA
jgi:hypothetical protein